MLARPLCLALLLPLFVLACSDIGIGGECHHVETGEVLTQVRDVSGELFSVKKMPDQPDFSRTFDGCGVSVEAEVEEGNLLVPGYVYHPETGERLAVFLPEKGLRLLSAYEWY